MTMKIEGKISKRYGLAYGGGTIGSWDTAKEALAGYESYEKTIRPVTDRKKQYSYNIRDGRKEISIVELRRAAAAEK